MEYNWIVRRRGLQYLTTAVLGAGLLSAACGAGGPRADAARADRRLRVVTTVSPLTSLAANVAGSAAVVVGLVPEGTNSHTFEPPPSAAKALAQADLVFINGLGLEDPIADLAREHAKAGREIVALGEATIAPPEHIYDFSFPRAGGKPNPHLWTNPPMAKRYAAIMAEKMAARDPANASVYAGNAARLGGRFDALDRAVRSASRSMTAAQRTLLTYHDSFAYFAREYGWTVLAAIQPSDFEDPTAKDVAAIIGQIKRAGVSALFGSEVFPSPVLAQIGREAGVAYVDQLRDDDLPGKPGDPDHSLLGLLRFDFRTMVAGLGGDPAPLDALDVGDVVIDQAVYPQ